MHIIVLFFNRAVASADNRARLSEFAKKLQQRVIQHPPFPHPLSFRTLRSRAPARARKVRKLLRRTQRFARLLRSNKESISSALLQKKRRTAGSLVNRRARRSSFLTSRVRAVARERRVRNDHGCGKGGC